MSENTLVHVPWYKSKLLHGLLVIAVTHTLVHYKLLDKHITDEDISAFVDEALSWLGYAATAAVGAIVVRNPFVTSTQRRRTRPTPAPPSWSRRRRYLM
jgi:hypothetical protein